MSTGLNTRWEFDAYSGNFEHLQNSQERFEKMVMDYFQSSRPQSSIESMDTMEKQHKTEIFSVDGFCEPCNSVFKATGC